MYSYKDITIIIPSIIKGIDKDWIKQINDFHIEGLRIIICIPPSMKIKEVYKNGFNKNILIINSDRKGQVRQRNHAYKFCKTKLILHMDDDILIDLYQIKGLVKIFNTLPSKSCLAPYLENRIKNNYKKSIASDLFRNIFLYFNLKPQSGTISLSCFPVPFIFTKPQVQRVDWLPGGISLLRKEHCIKENYFKFSGKAYCEDLFHSFYLQRKNIKLYMTNKFTFYTHVRSYRSLKLDKFIKYLNDDFRIRNEYRIKVKKPFIALLVSYLFIIVVYFFNKLSIAKKILKI